MFTPHSSSHGAPMSPIDHSSAQRISLSLSDLVSPGLKEYDDLESSVASGNNDNTNYKKELKKLLAKSRGTAYEATLRRFVEAKYTEIKKDEASNRKLFGSARGAAAVGPPSIASLSKSKYDSPSPMTLREANALHLSGAYQDGRIVENNYNVLCAQERSPQSGSKPSWTGNATASHQGYSILNEMGNLSAKKVSLDVSYHNKTRIEEMAKPVPRNVYKGPPPVPQYSGTNHLGRQRPPPNTASAASPDRRPANASPFSSPYRARKQAISSERSLGGASAQAGSEVDGTASVGTLPTFLQQALDRSRGERSYEEFQAWLESNREWRRRREFKLANKESEVVMQETHAFQPKILSKTVKLAEKANERAFRRMAAQSADMAERRGRSTTRSPSPYTRQEGPTETERSVSAHREGNSHFQEHRQQGDTHQQQPLRISTAPGAVAVGGGAVRRDRADSIVSTSSERSGGQPRVLRVRSESSGLHASQLAGEAFSMSRAASMDEHSAHPEVDVEAPPGQPYPTAEEVLAKPPVSVYERLAARGKVKAQQTFHYDLPAPQDTFSPRISEKSVKLAEKKHQRDAIVRARAASADPTGKANRSAVNAASQQNTTGSDFLSRNYDYYELYSMPERYLSRAINPVPYKQHGRRDSSVERKAVLEGSGLSKVAEKIASRSSSPVPKSSHTGGGGAGLGGHGNGGEGVLSSDLSVRADVTEKVRTHYSADQARATQVSPDRSIYADEGGKYSRFSPPKPASQGNNNQASSMSFSEVAMGNLSGGTADFSNNVAQISVHAVAREAIRERGAQARQRREQALQDFNRRHFLSPETKEAKPFQPLLMATETHRIMSRIRSTFDERTNKSVESQLVRREVAKMFPSPGPGRYTNGIAVDKLESLSVGSPRKIQRSRSLSPVPGHRGFSFSRERLARIESPSPTGAMGMTQNSMNTRGTAGAGEK